MKKLDKKTQSNKICCLLGIILLIFLMIKIERVEAQQSTIVYHNVTRVYNITSGHLQIFNKTGDTDNLDLPPEGTDALDGQNVTTCSDNLIQSDNLYCFATSKNNNREPWIRFEFDIQEQLGNITSIRISMEATSTGDDDDENGNFIHRNFSNAIWSIWAPPARTTDATRTITYTSQDITNVINASGKLMLLAECAEKCDNGELVRVDHVEVVINYTYNNTINTAPSFNISYPQINSTTGINQTTEDLSAIFSATDLENNTLKFNITWFTNNVTNFTTASYNYSINKLNITILDKANLTAGDTWIAMVNLFDGQLITRKNTTELLILNAPQINTAPSFNISYPQINSTTGINQTTEDLSAIFSATDLENNTLKFNITWFTNNVTNFTTASYNYSINKLNITILDKANLTAGDTWIAMVNLFDGQLITRKNTTELLILNAPQINTQTTTNSGSGPSGITQEAQETQQIVTPTLIYPDCWLDIDCNTDEICKYTLTEFYKQCVRNIQPTLENETQLGGTALTAVGTTPQTTVGKTPTGLAVIGKQIKNILKNPPKEILIIITSTIFFLLGIYYSIFKKK